MGPYLLLLTAAVLTGVAAWFHRHAGKRGEIGLWFLVWVIAGALSAVFSAVSWWLRDLTISLSFRQMAMVLTLMSSFFVFLFARSFARNSDHTLFFWSLPLQFAAAAVLINGDKAFSHNGNTWVLEIRSPPVLVNAAAMLFYAVLALFHILALLQVLRREGREREGRRVSIVLAALLFLLCANVLGDVLGARNWFGSRIPLVELAWLVGALILARAVTVRTRQKTEV